MINLKINGTYRIYEHGKDGKNLTSKDIATLIRNRGLERLKVTDSDGNDWTKEILCSAAFSEAKMPRKYTDIISNFIPEEVLYEIIEEGGALNVLNRKYLKLDNDPSV